MKWENQFNAVEQSELLRTTVEIPHALNAQIKSYEPKTGVLQNTISILLTKLSDELRKSNITIADRYAYQRAITDATITLGGSERGTFAVPPTGPVNSRSTETPSGNDNGGVAKVARKTKGAQKLPNIPKPCGKSGNDK